MVNERMKEECHILHLGSKNNNYNYSLNGKPLESIQVERDLGILVDAKLSSASNVIRQQTVRMQF